MNFIEICKIFEKVVKVSLKGEDKKPGVSYIVSTVLTFPAIKRGIIDELLPIEILQISYMLFFVYQGDDYETAEWKCKNKLYIFEANEVNDLGDKYIDCSNCNGVGYLDCDRCDNNGAETCDYCGGDGLDAEGDECEDCGGRGEVNCGYCGGEGTTLCLDCSGIGNVRSEEEYVSFNTEIWVFSNEKIFKKLKELKDKDVLINNFYDILDQSKGILFLIKTEVNTHDIELDEFRRIYGDYFEHEKDYLVSNIENLKDSNYNFTIKYYSNKTATIT
jgi:RecJ-like exonuclease